MWRGGLSVRGVLVFVFLVALAWVVRSVLYAIF